MRRSVCASFRKLVGRNLCPPSANSGFAFSRSRFSSSVGHPLIHSSSLIDSVCCLSADGCGSALSPVGKLWSRSHRQPVRLQSVQGRGEEAQKGAPFYNMVVDGQKVVSLSRFRRPSIRIKHSHFSNGLSKIAFCRLERGGIFMSDLYLKNTQIHNKTILQFLSIFESLSANGVQILIFAKK